MKVLVFLLAGALCLSGCTKKATHEGEGMSAKEKKPLEIVSMEIWRTSPPPPHGLDRPQLDGPKNEKTRWTLTSVDSPEFKTLADKVVSESKVQGYEEDFSVVDFMNDSTKSKSGGKGPSGGSGHTDIYTLNFNDGQAFEFSHYSDFKINDPTFHALIELTLKDGK